MTGNHKLLSNSSMCVVTDAQNDDNTCTCTGYILVLSTELLAGNTPLGSEGCSCQSIVAMVTHNQVNFCSFGLVLVRQTLSLWIYRTRQFPIPYFA